MKAGSQQNQAQLSSTQQQPFNLTIGKSLGKGTFGKVKLAIHNLTGEKVTLLYNLTPLKVAVKILEKDKIKDKKDVERITREIKILKKVRHPNVIQLYEVKHRVHFQIIETESELYLIMEFCQHGELFDYIVAHSRLSEKIACKYYQELIAGIEYIHQSGICHRDLKPENLLLDYDKTLKIVDFGLSNMYDNPDDTLKTACGSPCYAAPEMIAGKRYQGLKSDLWSSGVVLFAMVCGFLPFEDPKTSNLYKKILAADYQLPKFVSSEFADFLSKILNTNPDTRYSIEQIRDHPWYRQCKEQRRNGLFPGKEKMPFNEQVFSVMQQEHNFDHDYAIKCLEANRHNQITATYHLLHKKLIRGGKSVSDYPTQGAGSVDRAASQISKVQRVQRQEQLEEYIKNKRGQSINGGRQQDMNMTLPVGMYPQALQGMQGAEERVNLQDADLTAQKKFKLQLQAEISKLKQKYQPGGKRNEGVKQETDELKLLLTPPAPLNDAAMIVQDQTSPSGVLDQTVQIQKQPSNQSKQSSYHQPAKSSFTESTNLSSTQPIDPRLSTLQATVLVPLSMQMQTLQPQIQPFHQRFKSNNSFINPPVTKNTPLLPTKVNLNQTTQMRQTSLSNKTQTLDPITDKKSSSNTQQLFNHTIQQFTQILPDKFKGAQKRGNSSFAVETQKMEKRNSINQSINMSQVVNKQDYSYPISGSKVQGGQRNSSKVQDLRLQTPLDLQNFRTYTNNSSNNKNQVEFFIKHSHHQPTTKGNSPSTTLKSQGRYTRNQTNSPAINKGNEMSQSVNLNIQELYKQYQQKHLQQMNATTTMNFYTQKPPTSHYRAISVIESASIQANGQQLTNRQTPQIKGRK